MMYYVLPESMRKWVYKVSSDEDRSSGCIGHVRGYFDSSDTFFHDWFPHAHEERKTAAFRSELNSLMETLRCEKGLLGSMSSLRKSCRSISSVYPEADIRGDGVTFAYVAESEQYIYAIRVFTQRGDYNAYVYCFDKMAMDSACRTEWADADKHEIIFL